MKQFLLIFFILILIFLNVIIDAFMPNSIHSANLKSNSTFSSNLNNIKISTKKINYSKDYIEVNLNIPTLTGLKNKDIEDRINEDILNNILECKNKVESLIKSDIENKTLIRYPYAVQTNYDVHYTSSSFLSLTIMYYEYTGGAHGTSCKIPYNINLNTGQNITLKKLFNLDTNYTNFINNEIQLQIDKKNSVHGAIPITEFKSIRSDQPFYIDGNNLVVYFQPYEIGAYALGIQEFEIPLSKLKGNCHAISF